MSTVVGIQRDGTRVEFRYDDVGLLAEAGVYRSNFFRDDGTTMASHDVDIDQDVVDREPWRRRYEERRFLLERGFVEIEGLPLDPGHHPV